MRLVGNYRFHPHNNTISCDGHTGRPFMFVKDAKLLDALQGDPTTPIDLTHSGRGESDGADMIVPGQYDNRYLLFVVASHDRQRLLTRECVSAKIVMQNVFRNAAIAIVERGATIAFRHRQFVERVMFDGATTHRRVVQEQVL